MRIFISFRLFFVSVVFIFFRFLFGVVLRLFLFIISNCFFLILDLLGKVVGELLKGRISRTKFYELFLYVLRSNEVLRLKLDQKL